MANENSVTIGKVIPTFKGDWNANTSYSALDVVVHKNITYVAETDILTGTEPKEGTGEWSIMARGAVGPQGEKGIQGIQGPTGPIGPTGPVGPKGDMDLSQITVGGRNYILNSSGIGASNSVRPLLKGASSDTSVLLSYSDTGIQVSNNKGNQEWFYGIATAWTDISATPLVAGNTYTISFKAKGTVPQVAVRVGIKNTLTNYEVSLVKYANVNNSEWTKVIYTVTIPAGITNVFLRLQGAVENSFKTGFVGGETFTFKELKLEAGNVPTDWSPAPEDINPNMSVGGRNYLLNSAFLDGFTSWNNENNSWTIDSSTYQGNPVIKSPATTDSGSRLVQRTNKLPASVTNVTVSFNAKGNDSDSMVLVTLYNGNAVKVKLSSSFSRYTVSLTVPANFDIPQIYFWNAVAGNNVFLNSIKLEAGNVPTDWTPTPDDMVAKSDNTYFKNARKLPDDARDFAVIASDTIKYQGIWYTDANTIANGPGNNWSWCTVEVLGGYGNGAGIIRTAAFGPNQEYTTTVNSGKMVGWKKVADDSNVVHKTGPETIDGDKTFTGNINFSGSTNIVSATTRGQILDGYDLNGYTDPYKYVINGAKDLVNYPSGASTYATLEVEKINDGTATQRVTDSNSQVFIRSKGGNPAKWSAWRNVSDPGDPWKVVATAHFEAPKINSTSSGSIVYYQFGSMVLADFHRENVTFSSDIDTSLSNGITIVVDSGTIPPKDINEWMAVPIATNKVGVGVDAQATGTTTIRVRAIDGPLTAGAYVKMGTIMYRTNS